MIRILAFVFLILAGQEFFHSFSQGNILWSVFWGLAFAIDLAIVIDKIDV